MVFQSRGARILREACERAQARGAPIIEGRPMDPHDEGPGRQVWEEIVAKRREASILEEEANFLDELWKQGDWAELLRLGVVQRLPDGYESTRSCSHESVTTPGGHGSFCKACSEPLS